MAIISIFLAIFSYSKFYAKILRISCLIAMTGAKKKTMVSLAEDNDCQKY